MKNQLVKQFNINKDKITIIPYGINNLVYKSFRTNMLAHSTQLKSIFFEEIQMPRSAIVVASRRNGVGARFNKTKQTGRTRLTCFAACGIASLLAWQAQR